MTAVAVRMNGEIVVKMNLKKWRFVLIALLVIPLLLASILASANPLGPTTSPENESLATAPEEELVIKVDPVMELATTPVYDYVDDHISTAWGAVDSFTNMKSASTAVAIFTEEHDGGNNYRFEAVFRFNNPRIHHYLHKDLQVRGKNRDWIGVAYEDLHAYWSHDQSSWDNVFWNPLVSGGVMQTLTAEIRPFSEGDVYIKLVGAVEEGWPGDWGCQNIWDIGFMRLKMEDYMTEQTLTCDALFDSDNLYAMRGSGTRNYAQFVITAYDEDGGWTVDGSELIMYTAPANEQWSVAWTAAGGFTEDDPNGYITLVSGSTAAYRFTMIITYRIEIEWDHPDLTNVIMSSWTFTGDFGGNILTPNWDVETRLTMQGPPAITSDRVNLGATADYAGDVKYYGSAANVAPLASEVNVEVRRTSPTSTGWVYTDDPASDGSFTVNPSTDSSTAGSNLFELRVVADGDTTNLLTSTYSDTVIGDRVEVVSGSPGSVEYNSVYAGGVVNTGDTDTLYFQLRWESDLSAITSGTVTWSSTHDTVSMSYDSGDTRWEGTTYARASYGAETYNTLSVSVDGVTAVKNEPSYSVAWDEIEILTTVIEGGDNHVNIGNSVTIRVTARLKHFAHDLVPGTDDLYMNGVKMSDGGTYFTCSISHLYSDQWSFSVDDTNALEKTYGISKISSGKPSVSCTWDTLMVELSVDDSHGSIDDTVRVWAHVTHAYDGSVMSSGTVILRHSTGGDISMTYSPADEMWYADVIQSEIGQWVYYVYSISDPTNGLTTIGRGTHFDGSNAYVNCGSDSSLDLTSSLSLSVWFYGDGSNWGSGMYILAKKDDNNAQYALYVHSDGILKFVYYNGALREIDLESWVTRNTWHHVVVTVSETTLNCWYDGSHVQDDLTLPASLVSFSSVPLHLGAEKSGAGTGYHLAGFISEATVYNTTLSGVECELLYLGQYPETSNLRLLLDRTSFDAADGVWYDLSNSTNDGALNQVVVTAGSIPMSSDEVVRPIWDQIKVVGYTSDNPDIDVGTASSCHVTLQYAFDGRPVEDGIVTVNGVLASPGAVLGVWDFSEMKSSAQGVTYDSVSYSGGAYGLSSVDQNSQTITQVWEQILVLTTTVVDSSIDVGTPAEVRVMARLTYHSSHSLGASDDLYMNGVKMSWSGSYFYYRPTQSDVGLWNYYVNSTGALEDTYGISAVNVTGLSVDITWTGLIIDITDPIPQWVNVGENASGISISVTYAHNGAPYDGTVSLNSTQFIYNDAGCRGFRLLTLTGDDTLGITYVITDDETWCIWDGVIITITDPTHQTLIVGQNASGIVVSACYAYDGQIFDGTVQLNNTQFEYLTPGRRGYTVSSISGGSRGIDAIVQNDETYAVWVLHQAMLHLKAVATSVFVSTLYDPHNFSVDVYLTDTDLNMISGWINLTIGGEDYAVYCDGMINATFDYSPITSGEYTLQAVFEGDSVYAAVDTSLFLTATSRDIVFVTGLPSEMIPMTPTSFRLFNVYDNDFQGQFQGVTYNRDYPVNTSFSIWWTLFSDYGDPKNYVGTWDINAGEGTGQVTVPWDLDGDNRITSDDFTCYFIIYLDGSGIYENITVETPVNVLQPLDVILQVPALTYSDQTTLSLQLRPLYDSSSIEHLDLDVALFVSDDNSSWVLIAEVTTTASGWIGVNWTCTDSGTLFFKAETTTGEFYIESRGHAVSAADKETTTLTIECVGNFTYSDQGVLVALFSTDDGEPLSDYPVYLEIMDGTWVSIGSALTNGSGQASILWTPTLPAGTYSIQLRILLAESQFYIAPENAMGQLVVGKEFIVIDIDSTAMAQGYVRARVTDDDGNPVGSVQVDFYVGNNRDYRGSGITDTDGYARLNITLNDGELLQVVVNENNYYYGASQEVTVVVPVDLLFLTAVAGIVFLSVAGLAVTRKILRGRAATGPKPASPELRKALEEERDIIPERVREHTERRVAELDEVSHGTEETSELSSTTEPGPPTPPETGTKGDSD